MRSLRDKNLGMTNNSLAWNEQYSKPREHHRCWKGMCFLNLWEKTHRLRAWFSALAARCDHAVPGLSPGPSNQNLWAEARLGFLFLKALQVILKCNEGWTHYFKRKGYHRKIQQGTPRGYKWGAETPIKWQLEWFLSSLSSFLSLLLLLLWPLLISQGFKWGRKENKEETFKEVLYKD